MAKTTKSFLKWIGGKGRIMSHLIAAAPQTFNNYFEPFLGGGSVYFAIREYFQLTSEPGNGVFYLSDANPELITTFKAVQSDPDAVIERLRLLAAQHSKEFYLTFRKQRPAEPLDIAAWFIYLNKTCFNGMWRVNSKNEFNIPFGQYKNPTICDRERILGASVALQDAVIECKSFVDLIAPGPGDFIYCDPPYHKTYGDSPKGGYHADGFAWAEQVKVKEIADMWRAVGANVMLSNSGTDEIRELYGDYNILPISAPRTIGGGADRRANAEEFLITSY